MEISEKIKKMRKAKGLSQAALGKLIGTSQSAINYFENKGNELTISQIERIADALGISTKELLFGDSEIPNNNEINDLLETLKMLLDGQDSEIEDLRKENERYQQENLMNRKLLKDTINHTLDTVFNITLNLHTIRMLGYEEKRLEIMRDAQITGKIDVEKANKNVAELNNLQNEIRKDLEEGYTNNIPYDMLITDFFIYFAGNDLDYFFEKKYIEKKIYYSMYKSYKENKNNIW